MKLLLIEDEKELLVTVADSLKRLGFAVDCAEDGKSGYSMATITNYDCIVLDIQLPLMDGIQITQKLRLENNDTPIILLTARSSLENKLEGFSIGADDYLTKPFSIKELAARIQSVIKRTSQNKAHNLTINNYVLDVSTNILSSQKNKIELSNKETLMLEYLIRNKNKTIAAEEILEHVWDSMIDSFSDTVKTHIKTLRRKLESTDIIIKTLRGKGYLLQELREKN